MGQEQEELGGCSRKTVAGGHARRLKKTAGARVHSEFFAYIAV